LKYNHTPYRNLWFLVKKKDQGKYRLVNTAIEINRVTIRNTNLSPSVNEFSEEFVECVVASLINFLSGYNQVKLDVKSRDFINFHTSIGLLRMTTLSQGIINSVA